MQNGGKRDTWLTVIHWPEEATEADLTDLLARATGGDAADCRLMVRRVPPTVVAYCTQEVGHRAAESIRGAGGLAVAISAPDIVGFGPTRKIKDIGLDARGLRFEMWREEPLVLDPAELLVLVRAHVSEEIRPVSTDDSWGRRLSGGGPGFPFAVMGGWGVGGAFGIATVVYGRQILDDLASGSMSGAGSLRSRDRRLRISHKLDLHTRDGRVFQIDGDKFGFQVLGDQRGSSDNVNIDRLCEWFIQLAPDAAVDPYFSQWKAPPGFELVRIPHRSLNSDDAKFAFYSRWAAMMYRHLIGLGAPA
ncbi:MAG: hypothetical protein ACF8PN_12410 [Phycisphaerales bacterium]